MGASKKGSVGVMEETPKIEPVSLITPKPPAPDMTPKPIVLPQSVVNAVDMHHTRMKEAELNRLQKLFAEGRYTADEIELLVENGIIKNSTVQSLKTQILNRIPGFGVQLIGAMIMKNARTTLAGLVTALPVLIMGISSLIAGDTTNGIKQTLEAVGLILVGFFAKDAASTPQVTPPQQ